MAELGGPAEHLDERLGARGGVRQRLVRVGVDDAELVGERCERPALGPDADERTQPARRVEHRCLGKFDADTAELGAQHGEVVADVVAGDDEAFAVGLLEQGHDLAGDIGEHGLSDEVLVVDAVHGAARPGHRDTGVDVGLPPAPERPTQAGHGGELECPVGAATRGRGGLEVDDHDTQAAPEGFLCCAALAHASPRSRTSDDTRVESRSDE